MVCYPEIFHIGNHFVPYPVTESIILLAALKDHVPYMHIPMI